jgi:hypothetical protein
MRTEVINSMYFVMCAQKKYTYSSRSQKREKKVCKAGQMHTQEGTWPQWIAYQSAATEGQGSNTTQHTQNIPSNWMTTNKA